MIFGGDLPAGVFTQLLSSFTQTKDFLLPSPWINITASFKKIIQAFQNVCFVDELRERWNEIKPGFLAY